MLLLDEIIEAYKASSRKYNHFKNLIECTKWDDIYRTKDDTTVYVKDELQLEVNSLDPFDSFRPSATLGLEVIYF